MKYKQSILLGALVVSFLAFTSCGGDDSGSKNNLIVADQKFSLNNATFYLYDESEYDLVSDESGAATHKYVGLELFDNDTYAGDSEMSYYAYIQLYWLIDEEVGDDEFDVKGRLDEYGYSASSRICRFYFYFDLPEGSTYNEWPSPYKWVGVDYYAEAGTSISVTETSSGKIQVNFSGPLEYWLYDSELYADSEGWLWVDEDLKDTNITVEGSLEEIPSSEMRVMAQPHKK